jgi:membrane fusion protein, multidrug efflux system
MKREFVTTSAAILFGALLVGAAFVGCGEDEEPPRGMEQIQKEEGAPVSFETIERRPFVKYLTFYASLAGVQESTVASSISEQVESVRFAVGDYVRKGQTVVRFPKDSPSMRYEQVKAAYELAEKNYERMKALLEAGETSQANFDAAQTQFIAAKDNFESVKQLLFVESPISGRIIEMNVSAGDDIGPGKPLFTVAQLESMIARLTVSEEEAALIQKGMPAKLEFMGETFVGTVTEAALAMGAKTRGFEVKARFANPDRTLKSGVTADVEIEVYRNDEAIVVPRKLLRREGDKTFVFLNQGGTAAKRYVTPGKESGLDVEILEGIEVGDVIVVDGAAMLEEGDKLKNAK